MVVDTSTGNWQQTLKAFLKPSVIVMLFLGFSAGIPILLIFSSLSLWLREAGVERGAVTFFSWAALGYSFKFVWAPLVDRLPIPILTKVLGRRRSWILISQLAIICAILGMAFTDPAIATSNLTVMALFAVLLGFSSATQDICIDAYRIESDEADMQAIMSSTYIAGYRIAMIVAGAGALYLASIFGSEKGSYDYNAWKWTYVIMACVMSIGIATTFIMPEPKSNGKKLLFQHSAKDYLGFFILFLFIVVSFIGTFFISAELSNSLKGSLKVVIGRGLGNFIVELLRLMSAIGVAIISAVLLAKTKYVNQDMIIETYLDPVQDFFKRYGVSVAVLLLALVGLYRISDIVLGVIANVFYQDLGFSKQQIATVVKTFGLIMTLVGGFLGGIMTVRYGVMKILFLGAVLSASTNLLFMLLAGLGKNVAMLYLVISVDNLSAGLASAAFIAFLSSLTNVSFTAVQYAIFSSLMTLFPKILGGYSGSMVNTMGYPTFFVLTTLMGIPVLILIWFASQKLALKEEQG